MASNIQLAGRAIDEEHVRIGSDKPGRDAAIQVVMRLQLRELQLIEMLSNALEREAILTEQVRELLGAEPT